MTDAVNDGRIRLDVLSCSICGRMGVVVLNVYGTFCREHERLAWATDEARQEAKATA